MKTRTAIDLPVFHEELLDDGTQMSIVSTVLAWLAASPGVIATLGDSERQAQDPDRILSAVLFDERKAQSGLAEKMPSA